MVQVRGGDKLLEPYRLYDLPEVPFERLPSSDQ